MMTGFRLTQLLGAIGAIGALGIAGQVHAAAITPAPPFQARQLQAPPRSGWPTNGGNLYNQRYSPLTQIDRGNVHRLKAVWRASLRGSGLNRRDSGQAQVLAYDGTVYVVTGDDDAFAISVKTGEVLWEHRAHLNPDHIVVCCGWVSRGLGMGDGKIFVGQLDNKLVALDQRTGRVVWSVQAETLRHGGYSITSAPLYYDGLVITGFAGADMGIRGELKAYDARSGALRWTFHTIPAPGEPGHETWPRDSKIWQIGGAAVWQTPAVDPELGLLYFSTGNPGPDLNGGVRPGDNLYSDSIVAIDAHTGKYRWHFQQVHHDIWDYDSPSPVVLFDAEVDGRPRKALIEVSKSGFAYILDRITGKPLIGIEERPVPQNPSQATAATQPFPVGDEIVPHSIDVAPEDYDLVHHGQVFTPFDDRPAIYKPQAGVNWPPSSYDPATHLLYVCANDAIGMAQRAGEKFVREPVGEPSLGGSFGRVDAPRRGIIAALDVTTNRLAWRRQWTAGCSGGSVDTAGGLIFMGRGDGRLMAFDKRDGHRLWEFQTDAPIDSPPSVFEYQGEEYVVTLAGGTYYSAGKRGDGVWLFSLHGTLGPVLPGTAAAGTAAMAAATQAPLRPVDSAHGRSLYVKNCLPCHGATGKGSHGEGAAFTPDLTVPAIVAIATNGRRDMPPFRGVIAAPDLRDIAGYITDKLLAPGGAR